MSEFQMPCFERRGMKEDQWLDVKSQESQGYMCIILVILVLIPAIILCSFEVINTNLNSVFRMTKAATKAGRHVQTFCPESRKRLVACGDHHCVWLRFSTQNSQNLCAYIWKNICTWQITYLMQVVLFSRLPKGKKRTTILSRAFYLMSCNFNHHN